ncbi:putative metalloprotease CJM1_0395 family protein [Thermodesulfatator atlanticus]|uniref:putative metalloprotease CJM1_0395 family protein n=1 Tax=Thermodesulfatator atlanticus TaxID=501497 RepID=UPI000429A13F|nr:putative metalloprotease CJM1_0395 family protein [Thermodesulfatator atlanticus]
MLYVFLKLSLLFDEKFYMGSVLKLLPQSFPVFSLGLSQGQAKDPPLADNALNDTSKKTDKFQALEQKLKLAEQQRLIQKLKRIDKEVRAHEQAHMIAGGRYVRGAANYKYVRGPDGNYYAVAGEVKIDTSPVPGDPEATLEKARTIKRAALAPANPSAQDRMVAAQADRLAMKALEEIQKKEMQKILATYAKNAKDKESSDTVKNLELNIII